MSNLIATGQIGLGDVIKIDLSSEQNKLIFSKERAITSFPVSGNSNVTDFMNRRVSQAAARFPTDGEAASERVS
jgi:hypothetical protein